VTRQALALVGVALLASVPTGREVRAGTLRVGVVQTVIEDTLAANEAKIARFIDRAGSERCRVVVFPEGALYWADIARDAPAKGDLDAAIDRLGRRARAAGLYVIFGTGYRSDDTGPYHHRGVVYDPQGRRLLFYRKDREVPRPFDVDGIPWNLSICSDRGYLEHSDLPCLVHGSQVIVDISGGHGGDDGRPDLRWIRYRPWARRTNAYVIVSNPVHEDTDFMGHRPWGGGSAVIRPDGSVQASRLHEKDVLIVEEVDPARATRAEAQRRRNHPLFRAFWDQGQRLLEGQSAGPAAAVTPLVSAQRKITIAAAQMACSRNLEANTDRILRHVARAAEAGADIVVFPELAVTGSRPEDVAAAEPPALEAALRRIRTAARQREIHAIVGMPFVVAGARRNCAFVIGDDGAVMTCYAQIVSRRPDLFRPGSSAASMWFALKGVHAIVTVGDDADWVEIADLAASRGMVLHFHISYQFDPSPDAATFRRQRDLLVLQYAMGGAVVNAADPSAVPDPSAPASGGSLIVSREGGHNKAAPEGLQYYLPYQTSIVRRAGRVEDLVWATRQTVPANPMDLLRSWRNRHRKARAMKGWDAWIAGGAAAVHGDSGD
jgi:predicted amidohydrolase